MNDIKKLQTRIKRLETMINEVSVDLRSATKSRRQTKTQSIALQNMSRALCVGTMDPFKRNRVQFYHPILHDPDDPVQSLPWAYPISSMGGIDDCGLNWVAPAGSTLCIIFENGVLDNPFYIGTTWHNYRGPGGRDFPYPMPEYSAISAGHRGGYLVGANDESQVHQPWDTESYNGFNVESMDDFTNNPEEQKQITYPNIYGFKTPEKHMLKMVDGNAKCNRRWKRIELMSGCGNWMIFKDDHMHYGGQWAHPSCPPDGSNSDLSICSTHTGTSPYLTDPKGQPIEQQECSSQSSPSTLGGHPSTPGHPPETPTRYYKSQGGANKFFKHQNECRPYKGPGTPQNNKCALPQTGIQMLTIGGHTVVMDDSVEEPSGAPIWERSMDVFDFGCNNKCLGVFYMKSMTGHAIWMSDVEDPAGVRGEDNVIELKSAAGNKIQLNDHTIGGPNSTGCPPNYAGEKRGIHMQSTSNHVINMCDYMNEQCAPYRKEGGVPAAKATHAYVQIRSGYGLEIMMKDSHSQEETQHQWIQITNPQCAGPGDKYCQACDAPECRGPHFLRFQGRPRGRPGVVFLRAGGHAVRSTYDMDIVLVGDKDKNPSDKFTYVSKMRISVTEDVDFRYSGQLHVFFAEKYILLMAGRDCPPPPGKKCKGPCLYPVIIGRCPVTCPLTGITHWTEKAMSERVFASGYHPCDVPCGKRCVVPGQGPPCKEDDEGGLGADVSFED